MTNSRLTDPEVLSGALPVRWRTPDPPGQRRGRRWRGGDGAVRRIRFLEPTTASTLSGHRRVPPYAMAGGAPGEPGRNLVHRADGTEAELAGCDSVDLAAGDVLEIRTPGGGGYGRPDEGP